MGCFAVGQLRGRVDLNKKVFDQISCLRATWVWLLRVYSLPRCVLAQYTFKQPLQSVESLEEPSGKDFCKCASQEQGTLKRAAKPLHLIQHSIEGTMHTHAHEWQGTGF